MDFELSDDQRMLKDSVERLLSEHYDFAQRNSCLTTDLGWSRPQWARFAEMGLLALPFAESDGGFGGGPVEMMIVMEAMGGALTLEPYFATIVLGGGFLRLGGSHQQRASLVPRIANGELFLAFAHVEKQARYNLSDIKTTAKRDSAGWRLNGQKCYVVHGGCADMLIVAARSSGDRLDSDGISLFLVDADTKGISRRGYVTQDRLHAADIAFDNVLIEESALIGMLGTALPLINEVVDNAIAALCAEAVGAMNQAHEMTLDYLKVRNQFGQAIGTFQALQHRAVDMYIMTEQARSMALYAAMMASDADPLERRKAMSAAKIQIGRSGKYVGEQTIQLHGGVGLTDEYQAGHFFRRLSMIGLMFGDASHHLTELSRVGGLVEPAVDETAVIAELVDA